LGREHFRKRQHLYLCIAGLAFYSFCGCAAMREVETRNNADKSLLRGQELFAKGDYEGALRENQAVVSAFDKEPPGDKALFSMGLIFAHQNNPQRDYEKSMSFFTKLIEDYPQSALAEQAKIWVHILESPEKEKQVSREPEKKKPEKKPESKEQAACRHLLNGQELLIKGDYQESLRENEKVLSLLDKKSPGGDKALFTMGLIYVHYNNLERDYRKSMECFTRLVEDYPQSPLVEQAKIWVNILDIIEKEKQVDIEIEQKKKDLERQEQQ
jgi:tetratricopeptide (TPR) repeat protein